MIGFSFNLFQIYEKNINNDSYLLVIENKRKLYSVLKDLYSNCILEENIVIFDVNNKKQKVSDYIDFIPSLLSFDINNRKNLSALLRLIKKTMGDSLEHSKIILDKYFMKLFEEIKLESPIDIISDIDINEDDLLKILNININEDDNSILERVETYIKVSYELRKVKIFIFYNLLSLLEESDILKLIKNCKYNDIKLINIENNNINIDVFDFKIVLDKDICLLK